MAVERSLGDGREHAHGGGHDGGQSGDEKGVVLQPLPSDVRSPDLVLTATADLRETVRAAGPVTVHPEAEHPPVIVPPVVKAAPVIVKPIAPQPKLVYPIYHEKPMISYAPIYQKPVYYAPMYQKLMYRAPKVYLKKYELPAITQVIAQKPHVSSYPIQYHEPKVVQVPAPQINYVKLAQPIVHSPPVYQSAVKPYCP